jgi:hypothetical protein
MPHLFADLGSAGVYLLIAIITDPGVIEASG